MIMAPTISQTRWESSLRWQEYIGEIYAAVFRLVLVVFFYGLELANYLMLANSQTADAAALEAAKRFHSICTLISGSWLVLSLMVLVALNSRFMPRALKYGVTLVDILLLTLLAAAGQGSNSPLIAIYFVLLAMSALRFRRGLVWFTGLACIFGYMALVGKSDATWFDANHATPLLTQSVFVAALISATAVIDRMLASIRSLLGRAREFERSLAAAEASE